MNPIFKALLKKVSVKINIQYVHGKTGI